MDKEGNKSATGVSKTATPSATVGSSKTLTIKNIPSVSPGTYYWIYLLSEFEETAVPVAGFKGGPITGDTLTGTLLTVENKGVLEMPDYTATEWTGTGEYYIFMFTGAVEGSKWMAATEGKVSFISNAVEVEASNLHGDSDGESSIKITGIPADYAGYNANVFLFSTIPSAGLYNGDDLIRADTSVDAGKIDGRLRGPIEDKPYHVVITFTKYDGTSTMVTTFKSKTTLSLGEDAFDFSNNFSSYYSGSGKKTLSGTNTVLKVDGATRSDSSLLTYPSPSGGSTIEGAMIGGDGSWTMELDSNLFLVGIFISETTNNAIMRLDKWVLLNDNTSTSIGAVGTYEYITLSGTVGTITLKDTVIVPGSIGYYSQIYADFSPADKEGGHGQVIGDHSWTILIKPQTTQQSVTFEFSIHDQIIPTDQKEYRKQVTPASPVTVSTTKVEGIVLGNVTLDDSDKRD
ncbi:hypothetical protein LQZ19_06140 [Treponema primitia]